MKKNKGYLSKKLGAYASATGAVLIMENLSPEQKLLVTVAKPVLSPRDVDRINGILEAQIKWFSLEKTAARLGVVPLLYKHLSTHAVHHVPHPVLDRLREGYRLQSLKNLRVCGQIKNLLNLLNQAEIPVMLLKGASLAWSFYGDSALRPMSDVDILVPDTDAEKAHELLIRHGYEAMTPVYQSGFHEQVENSLFEPPHLPALCPKRGVCVEIHQDLFARAPATQAVLMPLVWRRAVSVEFEAQKAFVLCPEDMILYSALHLYCHMRGGRAVLYWFSDLDILIRWYEGRICWDQVVGMSEDLGISAWIRSVFHIMSRYWQTPFPIFLKGSPAPGELIAFKKIFDIDRPSYHNFLPSRFKAVCLVGESRGWSKALFYIFRHLVPRRACIVYRYDPKTRKDFCAAYGIHFRDRFRFAFYSLHDMIQTFRQSRLNM